MRKKIVAGNWKMNKTALEAIEFVNGLKDKVKDATADVVVCPSLVCGRIYPGAGHSGHIVWNNGVDFIPDACVVAAGVSGQSDNIHPGFKHWCVKEELLGHRLFVGRG